MADVSIELIDTNLLISKDDATIFEKNSKINVMEIHNEIEGEMKLGAGEICLKVPNA